jgi:hypothetical protein
MPDLHGSSSRGRPSGDWRHSEAVRAYLDAPVTKPPRIPPGHPTEDWTWIVHGLCAQVDLDLMFPEPGGLAGEQVHHAKQMCAGCPVREQCLGYALAHHERFGVWGGLSVRERDRLEHADRRLVEHRRIHHGTQGGYHAHRRRGEDACEACLEAERRARPHHRPAA